MECAYGYANPVPLYMCTAALEDPGRHGRGLAYTTRTYPPGLCPKAEDVLNRSFLIPFNEQFTADDANAMADRLEKALRRVVTAGA